MYWYWLCNIPGIGNVKRKRLAEYFGTAAQAYEAAADRLMQVPGISGRDVQNILENRKIKEYYRSYQNMKKKGIHFLYLTHPDYPERLKNLHDAPAGLYFRGHMPRDDRLSVAIVGARACSDYGRSVAEYFGAAFAKMGIQVISGMAVGIDAAGHAGSLRSGGYTCAVMGCGVDICYPSCNINMYMEILQNGCIISEYAAGTPPRAGQFPPRNRIISGLSDIVVVVEAREKSGSLITADQALEQNREVMVVPGRISDVLSQGCNSLIQQGAQMITSPEDILQCGAAQRMLCREVQQEQAILAQSNGEMVVQKKESAANLLATAKHMVYSVLDLYPKSLDNIIEDTGLDIRPVSEALLMLLLEGQIREVSPDYYVRDFG